MTENGSEVNGLKPVDEVDSYPLTVLRTKSNDKYAVKKWVSDGYGGYKKEEFDKGWQFSYFQFKVFDIHSLSDTLMALATNNHAFVIRGQLKPDKDPHGYVEQTCHDFGPTSKKPQGQIGYFQSCPNGLPWLIIDIDEVLVPEGVDFLSEPLKAIEFGVSLLPSYFQNVSYHYQLSNSAGLDGGKKLKVHLGFWLDKPVHDKTLRLWAGSVNKNGKIVDPSLYSSVQAHFIANPIFDGCPDPFPSNRSGFVQRDSDDVVFPEIDAPTYKLSNQSAYEYDGSTTGLSPTAKFTYYVEGIGDHKGGLGFHEPIMMAIWSYVCVHGANGTDVDALKQKLRNAITEADQSGHDPSYIATKLSDQYLDGLISGACLKIGAKGKTSTVEVKAPHYQKEEVSEQNAQQKLNGIIKSFFDDPRDIALRAPAGIGKTTGVGMYLPKQWLEGKKIELYLPTHALAAEVVKKLHYVPHAKAKFPFMKGVPSGIEWQIIRGRDRDSGDENVAQCYKVKVVEVLTAKGLAIYPNVCHSGKTECNYYGNCGYIRQFQGEWDVRVFPQAYLGLDRFFLDKDLPDGAIIDESFYAGMLIGVNPLEKGVPFTKIQQSYCSDDLKKLLINTPPNAPLLGYLRKQMGEDQLMDEIESAIALSEDFAKVDSLVGLPEEDQYKAAKALPEKSNIGKFLEVLRTELSTGRDKAHGIRVNKDNNGFRLCYRRPISRFVSAGEQAAKKTPVLAIDADLNEQVHGQFFSDFEYHEIKVKRKSRVIQCHSTKCSKNSLLDKEIGAGKRAEVQKIIDRVTKDKAALVVGAQAITGNQTAEEKIPSLVTVPEGSALAHFGGIRGIDTYKELDAVIIIGRNQPPIAALEAVAGALWYDSDEPLILDVENLLEEPRGYSTTTGLVTGVNVSVHPDPRIQILHELIREAESLQAVDRLRLIHGEKKDVYLLSNLVLDTDVDHLVTWDELVAGTTLLTDAWNKSDGVLPLNPDWLSKVLPEKFTWGSAKNYLNKKVGTSKGEVLNNLLVPDVTDLGLFGYTVAGTNNVPRKCVSRYGAAETRERLTKLLGGAVTLTNA